MFVHFLRLAQAALGQRQKFLPKEPLGSVIVMPDADAVASSLCKQAGITRPENCPPICGSKILTYCYQQLCQSFTKRAANIKSFLDIPACSLRLTLSIHVPKEQMSITSHHITSANLARWQKPAKTRWQSGGPLLWPFRAAPF